MVSAHRHRLSSRVIVVDERERILLFLTVAPDTSGVARWITPGGGVDPGESHHDAAVRELFEETGLHADAVGVPVFAEDFAVAWDAADHDTGHVEFYLLRTDSFAPSSEHWTDEERVDVRDQRWWSLDELERTSAAVEPEGLVALVRRVLAGTTDRSSAPDRED